MGKTHAAATFVGGLAAVVGLFVMLYIISGLWSGWQASGSFAEMAISVVAFSILTVRILWPLFIHWAEALGSSYGDEDDE